MTKKLFYLLLCTTIMLFNACGDDKEDGGYKTFSVTVELSYPTNSLSAVEGIEVKLNDTNTNASFTSNTDAAGKAAFTVPAGIYEASATDKRYADGTAYLYNGVKSNIAISDQWKEGDVVKLELAESKTNQLVIKELYCAGCQKDDGSGAFYHDRYIILYNNSDGEVALDDVCLAMVLPYNSNANSNADYQGDALFYEAENWIPAGQGVWYFTSEVKLQPGKQIVIALANAVDNTTLYSNSINHANANYYCTYDPEQYNNAAYYSVDDIIPVSHHLKAYRYGTGNAWPLSQVSPAVFIFQPKGVELSSFIADATTTNNYNNTSSQIRKKVPVEWVIDAIEVFRGDATNNYKRLTKAVDAGYVNMIGQQGYTLYRNVDKEATEAIEGNQGKLVYNYSLGTADEVVGTTDPSAIDAEASIKNGARIIYKDTNNSSNDFHQRKKASLRD